MVVLCRPSTNDLWEFLRATAYMLKSAYAIAIPSLQLGTVTLAGWRLSVACQCECLSAQRTRRGPAVSWAPRVGAHEFRPTDRLSVGLTVCPSV